MIIERDSVEQDNKKLASFIETEIIREITDEKEYEIFNIAE